MGKGIATLKLFKANPVGLLVKKFELDSFVYGLSSLFYRDGYANLEVVPEKDKTAAFCFYGS